MLDSYTKITGIFGDPVGHSLSPLMQNAAFAAKGLNFIYLPFHVRKEDLAQAVGAIISLGMAGVNVTAPHKEAIMPLLDELSPEAALLGAVNTVLVKHGRLKGYNTDVDGFSRLLQNISPLSVKGEKVCLLGAGGAARAVCLALAKAEVGHLAILNRTLGKGKGILDMLCKNRLFKEKSTSLLQLEGEAFQEAVSESAFIINCMSVDPIEAGLFSTDQGIGGLKAAIDLRYSPPELPLLKWAGQKGCHAVNGADMLLGQGIKAFEIFTGQAAPLQVMQNTLHSQLYA